VGLDRGSDRNPGTVNTPELLQKNRIIPIVQPLTSVFGIVSDSEKSKIAEAVSYGVFKMNIDTDTQFAFSEPVGKFVNENPKAFMYQVDPEDGTPYKKFYDPRKYLRAGELGIVERLQEACEDLGSKGKSIASA